MKGASAVAGLLLGSSIATIVACSHVQTPSQLDVTIAKHDQITKLWIQIRDWRDDNQWDRDPPNPLMQFVRGKRVREGIKACPVQQPTACNDVCSAGDQICDNAERICEIADELGKDDHFAQQKCTSAKASCVEAQQRCCECSTKPPASTEGTL
ncbi:MAG: hypothetical protein SFX73_05155 [Kofleriaceae bacterium]|nr:hypothetical protein [Kofleriaceae bacterium]